MGNGDPYADLARDAGRLLAERGLVAPEATLTSERLGSGARSAVLRIREPQGTASWCAKRPLAQLRAAGTWQASPERSAFEARWLETLGGWHPRAVPRLVAEDPAAHLILMTDLEPPPRRRWGSDLREGRIDAGLGARLGALLGDSQRRAGAAPELAAVFDAAPLFHALRTRPLLLQAAEVHPDRAFQLRALVEQLGAEPATLLHGDLEPGNVLVDEDDDFVLVDGACACWGAAHFDAAFLLTELMLAWARRPEAAEALRGLADAFCDAWSDAREGAAGDAVDRRSAQLVPGLLLGRVDGLVRAEELDPERSARVRSFARGQLLRPPEDRPELLDRWARAMGEID